MSVCYTPIKASKDAEGNIKFNGKDSFTDLYLPCGQCMGCRLNHAETWAIRMTHEAQLHEQNCFITLTYSDENLPENGSLQYDDVTKFLKRLRKLLDKTKVKIKYYRVGEYGEKLSRPHYHIILFGFDFSAKLRYRGQENSYEHWRTKDGNKYYVSSLLNQLWGVGHAELGEVNYQTCLYVSKYITKKINGPAAETHYTRCTETGELVSVEPEKASMSRREAIGKNWLEQYWKDIYPHDHCVVNNKVLKVPKYYDKWLEQKFPEIYQQVKISREQSQIDSTIDIQELARIHEVKYLTSKQHSRELEGAAPTNEIDEKIIRYNKNQAIDYHQRTKKC